MSKAPPAAITPLFITEIYRADGLLDADALEDLDDTCRAIADDDEAGQAWSQQKAYLGYTSYGSLTDLPDRAPAFAALKSLLDKQVAAFVDKLGYELGGKKLKLDNMWINVLEHLGTHSGHIHPHSVLSGTIYIAVPDGASALRFEDPRLGLMMNAPARTSGRPEHQTFVSVAPAAGTVLIWESWLRHEVPINLSEDLRISVSFNYGY